MTDRLYNIITDDLLKNRRGKCDNTYSRFIVSADSVFRLFLRSYIYRTPEQLDSSEFEFIVVDSSQAHIDMFKECLTWDGDPYTFKSLTKDNAKRLRINMDLIHQSDLVNLIKYFKDFKYYWDHYRRQKFAYYHLDRIIDSESFLKILRSFHYGEKKRNQYIYWGEDFKDYARETFDQSLNNVLHYTWLKSFNETRTLIEIKSLNLEDLSGKIYAKLNPTFCILPWNHIQYKPDGQAKLCCRYDTVHERNEYNKKISTGLGLEDLPEHLRLAHNRPHISTDSIEQSFHNSDYWNLARKNTVSNTELAGCHKCYKEEQKPGSGDVTVSMRLASSILYNYGYLHKKPGFNKPKLEFLEIGFGNYCNLACVSCNSNLSTTWHDNEVQLNQLVQDSTPELSRLVFPKLDNLRFEPKEETLKTLRIIKFTGGEPMINPEFIKFIDLVCEKGSPENIVLEIYTNCSYVPSPKLLINLARFKKIFLNLSIDAYGSLNDYLRYGSNWQGDKAQTVSRAIDFWLDLSRQSKNFYVVMSTTLSVLNIYNIPELIEWWVHKFKTMGNLNINNDISEIEDYDGFYKLQPLFDPTYLNINILPKKNYEPVVDWLNKFREEFLVQHPEFKEIPKSIHTSLIKLERFCTSSTGDLRQAQLFVKYIENLEKIRQNKLADLNPVLIENVNQFISDSSSG